MKMGLTATFALVLGLAVQNALGAEPAKATTNELPAALRVLNADQGQILTTAEAGTIRGECWEFFNRAPVDMVNGFGVQNYGGNVYISGKKVSIGSGNKFKYKGH
jgi:hypothetical protein